MSKMEEAGLGPRLQHGRTPIPHKNARLLNIAPQPPPSANRLASSLPLISGWSCCYLFSFPISSEPPWMERWKLSLLLISHDGNPQSTQWSFPHEP